MRKKTRLSYQEIEQNELNAKVRKILNGWYLKVSIDNVQISEDITSPVRTTAKYCLVLTKRKNSKVEINSLGLGFVDAIWRGIKDHFANEYSSLKDLKFDKFAINALLKKKKTTNAEVVAELVIKNSANREFFFKKQSVSTIAASVETMIEAIEYFINAELAIIKIYGAWKDAVKRQRADLVEKYVADISELVKITNYDKIIQEIKKEKSSS